MSDDKQGLARQLLDAFKLINELQLQINELRRRADRLSSLESPAFEKWMAKVDKAISTDGCEYPDCEPPEFGEMYSDSELAQKDGWPDKPRVLEYTRPADDDASEWEASARRQAWLMERERTA